MQPQRGQEKATDSGFQLPTSAAPCMAPSLMSVRRDRPRHMTVLPGDGSLVAVYRVFQANGTAFMAMKLYEGGTLKQWVKDDPARVTDAFIDALRAPADDPRACRGHHRRAAARDVKALGCGRARTHHARQGTV